MIQGEIFSNIKVFFRNDKDYYNKQILKKIMVVGDNKSTTTAERWAGNTVSADLPNKPFQATVVDIERRGNGGRALRCSWNGFIFDLREDEFLECLKDKGIGPGGKILNELIWGRVGSQTKALKVSGTTYNEIHISKHIKRPANKVKRQNFVFGNWYLVGRNEYKYAGTLTDNINPKIVTDLYFVKSYWQTIPYICTLNPVYMKNPYLIKADSITAEEQLEIDKLLQKPVPGTYSADYTNYTYSKTP